MSNPLPPPLHEPKRLGMDELSFFVQMVTFLLNDINAQRRDRFWQALDKHCPNLARALHSSAFTGEWSEITFTRSIRSTACLAGDDSCASGQEPDGREQSAQ